MILQLVFIAVFGWQPASLRFEKPSAANRLSQSSVFCIAQDLRGFLWIGTEDGLNRFDGYRYLVYRHAAGDSRSLANNMINDLFLDRAGYLWIATNGGLCRYRPESNDFDRFVHVPGNTASLSGDEVVALAGDSLGRVWVATRESGLCRFDPVTGDFQRFVHNPADPASLAENELTCLLMDSEGNLWVGGQLKGLNLLEAGADGFVHFQVGDASGLASNYIYSLLEDSAGRLWVGTWQEGIHAFDRESRSFCALGLIDFNNWTLVKTTTALLEDDKGRIWVATYGNGIFVLDPDTGGYSQQLHDRAKAGSLHDNYPLALFKDRTGLIWIGSETRGLIKHHPFSEFFQHIGTDTQAPLQLTTDRLWGLYQEGDLLWVATFGEGLLRFDLAAKTRQDFQSSESDPHALGSNYLTVLLRDRTGVLWVATYGAGLYALDEKSGRFSSHWDRPEHELDYGESTILTMIETSDGELWTGTRAGGIKILDRKREEVRVLRHDPSRPGGLTGNAISKLFEDRQGRIWVALENGDLSVWRPQTETFEPVCSEPGLDSVMSDRKDVGAIAQDAAGRIWLGGNGGLGYIDEGERGFQYRRLDPLDGLLNQPIKSMTIDDRGFLWLGTNQALLQMDPVSFELKAFDYRDGLHSQEFYWASQFKGADGRIWVGGTDGIDVFSPGQLNRRGAVAPVEITAVKIFDQRGIDSRPFFSSGQTLTFAHDKAFFTLEFSLLDFGCVEKNQYAYRLGGDNEEWIHLGTNREITFPGLAPGRYQFQVKATNQAGNWTLPSRTQDIVVLAPLWLRWWAKTIYAVILLLGLITAGLLYQRRVKRHSQRLLQRGLAAQQKEKMEALGTLAGGIAHDFNNMLASMMGFNYLAMAELDRRNPALAHLREVESAGEVARDLVSRILTFSRKRRPEYRPIAAYPAFCDAAKLALISFPLNVRANQRLDAGTGWIKGDPTQIHQVILNLCANAVQALEGQPGEVEIGLRCCAHTGCAEDLDPGDYVVAWVRDTGKGMDEASQRQIFEPFYSTKSPDMGLGMGLAVVHGIVTAMGGTIKLSSAPGQGTCFELWFPRLADVEPAVHLSQSQPIRGNGQHVLWVDDDERILRFGQELLTRLGFRATVMSDPLLALARLKEKPATFDLFILDLQMPGLTGVALARAIREVDPQAAILLCTGQPGLVSEREARAQGFGGYLTKPFSPTELSEALAACLKCRSAVETQMGVLARS